MLLLRSHTSTTAQPRRWWVAIPPALVAGVAYYSSYSGAAVTAMIFPLMLLWWPGLPAVSFLALWSVLERLVPVRLMSSTPVLRAVVTGFVASGATVAIGGLLLAAVGGTSSAAILRVFPGWSAPFIIVSVLSCWMWAMLAARRRVLREERDLD